MSEYNNLSGEILDNDVIGAEQLGDYTSDFVLLPEGEYEFTVVKIESSRYTPGPNSKIGPCKQVVVTLRVKDPASGREVDLKHNLYMWSSTIGLIAQYQDAIGIHKKGEPLTFNWNPSFHEGKTGKLQLTHRDYKNKDGETVKTNNIKKMYPKETGAASKGGWSAGKF